MSLLLQRSGFLSIAFLVPLGFLANRYNFRYVWTALVFLLCINFTLTLFIGLVPFNEGIWDFLTFAALSVIFSWIISPPPRMSFNLPGSLRLLIGSCLGALIFIGVFFRLFNIPGFVEQIGYIADSLVPGDIDANYIISMAGLILLRGGSLVSCVLIFFISRHLGFFIAGLVKKERAEPVFIGFHVFPHIIWVFSVSLFLLVLSRIFMLDSIEILLWNVFIICIMLYMAQGLGILQFFLLKFPVPPVVKFSLLLLIILLMFNTVLSTILLSGIVLLGIAENWLPLRPAVINKPSSTPEA